MNTTQRHRRVLGGSAALVALAAAATVFLGVAPAAKAASCPPPPAIVHPFLPWQDATDYVPVTNGSFDSAASKYALWALSGGAATVVDQEPWSVTGLGGGALSLPEGSQAMSGCTTAPLLAPIVRFFVKNTGSPAGLLHVEIIINSKDVLDGGYVTATDTWQPTPLISVPVKKALKGKVDLRIRLTPIGEGASFLVDDLYVDPNYGS